ncbi:hypothetical protein G6F57_017734 [Rhizopus arrhizus]|nr:hypothetical protein G6F57_017734 [Rhizopus arrhizus]
MHRSDVVVCQHGHHDGGLDDDDRDRLHESAQQQQDHRQHQQHGRLAVGPFHQQGGQRLRHLFSHQHPGEQARGADDQQDGRAAFARGLQVVPQRLQAERAVIEEADQQGVDDGAGGGFGGGEDAEADAADDQHRHHQRGQGVDGGGAQLAPRERLAAGPAQQDARDDAGHEQLAHRGVGDGAVDDQHDAGRDDGGGSAGAADEGAGKALVVAAARHRRQQQAADGHHVGHARTGQRPEHQAGQHGHDRQAALDVAHDGGAQAHDALGQARALSSPTTDCCAATIMGAES